MHNVSPKFTQKYSESMQSSQSRASTGFHSSDLPPPIFKGREVNFDYLPRNGGI